MTSHNVATWSHDHVFLGEAQETNERRTRIVIGLTAVMMVIEVVSGIIFGSMALLADGWHMASHTAALSITAMAYYFARRHARNPSFSFGTGKIGELAGFASALLLAIIALFMAYESVKRFFAPVSISFDEAIVVAIVGLIVNLVSALLLNTRQHQHEHEGHGRGHADHNLRAAYLHVIADAVTSFLAIIALTTGRFFGWVWMDPLMGLVGAAMITRWSVFLLRDTGRVLLDMNIDQALLNKIYEAIESVNGNKIDDLHVWRIGPGHFAAILSIATSEPEAPHHYKTLLGHINGLSHITIEVNRQSEYMDSNA